MIGDHNDDQPDYQSQALVHLISGPTTGTQTISAPHKCCVHHHRREALIVC